MKKWSGAFLGAFAYIVSSRLLRLNGLSELVFLACCLLVYVLILKKIEKKKQKEKN